MVSYRVTVKPVCDALARAGLMVIRAPRGSFGGWDASIQRFVIMLPTLT